VFAEQRDHWPLCHATPCESAGHNFCIAGLKCGIYRIELPQFLLSNTIHGPYVIMPCLVGALRIAVRDYEASAHERKHN